jgi:hypothetical protein
METRLLGYEHAATVTEIAAWANDLIGKEAPGCPGYVVVKVVQFQLVALQLPHRGYDALLLVEVVERLSDAQVVLKEADVEVIEQITSSIEKAS